jgi:hypothetical protein
LVDAVSIDLNGFALVGKLGSSNGVFAAVGIRSLSVRNGTVKGWGRAGIEAVNAYNSQFADLRVDGNGGIGLDTGNGTVVAKCNAISNGGIGISGGNGSTIKDCTAQSNTGAGLNGFFGSTVIGCAVQSNTGVGISTSSGNTIKDCSVQSNSGGGISTAGSCTISGCSVYNNTGIGISTSYSMVEIAPSTATRGKGFIWVCRGHCCTTRFMATVDLLIAIATFMSRVLTTDLKQITPILVITASGWIPQPMSSSGTAPVATTPITSSPLAI